MFYQSTRNHAVRVESAEAIKTGLSEEGGLFVPERFPQLLLQDIAALQDASYQQRAMAVLRPFLTDFTEQELSACIDAAYTTEKWNDHAITPLHKLDEGLSVLELWHGPTCAFKDVALQILPHFLTRSIAKTGDARKALILVATSGDTGKAALEGFQDVEGTQIKVFYPRDGVSTIQKLQMTTQSGANVDVCGIKGNFDDAQNGVKRIFTDDALQQQMKEKGMLLSSANSINWGRLVPQIVYYVSAYCDLLRAGTIQAGELVNFVVPTGNFGDILAGYYAKRMGLPVGRLICASNRNNVLTDFIRTGVYDKNRTFYTTTSPSMDILISSNLERFLYHMLEGDDRQVKDYMAQLATNGTYRVDETIRRRMADVLWGGCCDDRQAADAIEQTFTKHGYLMDPHTAVGKQVYDQYAQQTGDRTQTVLLSTASPFKFSEAVLTALRGEDFIEGKTPFELLGLLSEMSGVAIPASLGALQGKHVRFPDYIEPDEMKPRVLKG